MRSLPDASAHTSHYFYFSRVLEYRDGRLSGLGEPSQAAGDLPRALPAADLIILEANEAFLATAHVEEFVSAVLGLPQGRTDHAGP